MKRLILIITLATFLYSCSRTMSPQRAAMGNNGKCGKYRIK